MNVKQADQKLRELMKRKPIMSQPGRLMAHLLNELKVESDNTGKISNTIERALCKMEGDGIVKVDRTGNVINGFEVTTKGKRELSGQKKASAPRPPVVQTPASPLPEATSTDEPELPAHDSAKMTRHEMVTLALHTLQELADEQGNLFVQSTAVIIADALGVTEAEARELNRPLGELGLRKSPKGRNDDGKRPHWVTQQIKEVTEEMLSQSGKPGEDQPTGETYTQLVEIITDLEQQLATATANVQATDALLEVISGLEAQVTELEAVKTRNEQSMQEGAETLTRLSDANLQLTSELAAVRAQLTETNGKLLQQAVVSPEVERVLARYGKKTTVAAR